ncbi:MAG: hypothetical protein N2504_07180 [candidate division WOR-3 bacterium]|nr:hypothetical protein [candidate division WOR-3 bacterium]MCX7948350.1 hypothetical protein [candidate division WOR-3 bacterium]MDW8151251.1 hypothetical protein [candidate division WOR-3 bacterium]
MKKFSIFETFIYIMVFWLVFSLITSLYSLYKVERQIKNLKDEIEKYKTGYILYKSRSLR